MSLANQITFLRILAIPFILVFLLPLPLVCAEAQWNPFVESWGRVIALILFIAASLTDWLDGRVARRQGLVTKLGKFLDPIADKMLVVSVLIAFVQLGRVHSLVTIVIILREFIVTGIRLLAAGDGVVIAAGNMGKAKTVMQLISIILMLAEPIVVLIWGASRVPDWITLPGDITMAVALLLTVLSGIDYAYRNRRYLNG